MITSEGSFDTCYDVGGLCIPADNQGAALQEGYNDFLPEYKAEYGLERWGPFEWYQAFYAMCASNDYGYPCSSTLNGELALGWLELLAASNRYKKSATAVALCDTPLDLGPPEEGPEPEPGEAVDMSASATDVQVEAEIDPAAAAELEDDRGLQAALSLDDRGFYSYLKSLQSQAAQGNATLTPEKAQVIWDEAISRGYTFPRGVESGWVGGDHINLYAPNGAPDIHFPVPDGWFVDTESP